MGTSHYARARPQLLIIVALANASAATTAAASATTPATVANPAAAHSSRKAKAALMPLSGKRIAADGVAILDMLVASELAASEALALVTVEDLNAMLGFERMRDMATCSDVACAAEIGAALGVQFIIAGSAGIVGDELLIQLALIDTAGTQPTRRGQAATPNDERMYRQAVATAVAQMLGRPAHPATNPAQTTPRGPSSAATAADSSAHGLPVRSPPRNVSAARFLFTTADEEIPFEITVLAIDGQQHRCAKALQLRSPCTLSGLPLGKALLTVTAPELDSFSDHFTVREEEEVHPIEVREMASPGNVIAWTFGALAATTGVALIATGVPLDKSGLVHAGLPSLGVGAGLLVLGFLIDGRVDVNYPGIDFLF